ncbi:MAG TPA: squalene synthase HpnC [Acidimicrobiales bacterium]
MTLAAPQTHAPVLPPRDVFERARHENFPVAIRLLPAAVREQLMAVYGFARLADDLGDEYAGDRLAALDWLEGELRRALDGGAAAGEASAGRAGAVHPVAARLARVIATTDVTAAPFLDLIEANRMDQRVRRYADWDDLLGYCRLSANPVGRAVLALAGAATPERMAWSDQVCTGLQVVEHLQDVGEDARAGRVYLPADDLARFGVGDADLTARSATPGLRAAVAYELARARELLGAGAPLVRSLRGWARVAVAGYVAGGLAAADAIAAAGYDTLAHRARPAPARVARHAAALLAARPSPRRPPSRRPEDGADGGAEGAGGLDLEAAYRACAAITRREAKNFAYGIALLRPPERAAMNVVYALARRIDDIVDEPGEPAAKLAELAALRRRVEATVATGTAAEPSDPILVGLAGVLARYPLPLDALGDLFDGCRCDVEADARTAHAHAAHAGAPADGVSTNGASDAGAPALVPRFATFDELVVYCRQVAGSIGRLSLAIFGAARPAEAAPLADDLGVALQLTNVLRDVLEDRDALGRVYLPAADLARFGCAPDASGPRDRLAALVTFEAERARQWYDRGLRLLPHLDHRSRACVGAMAGIYRGLLDAIERDPAAVLRGRVSLPTARKLTVALGSLVPRRGEGG